VGGGCQRLFVERDASGLLTLRRGFVLPRIRTCWWWRMFGRRADRRERQSAWWKRREARVVAAGALIDRSVGRSSLMWSRRPCWS